MTKTGFKADLARVCGCSHQIVGRTQIDLLENLRTHMKDVHKTVKITKEVKRKLKKAANMI